MAEGARLTRRDQRSGRFSTFKLFDRLGASKDENRSVPRAPVFDGAMGEAGFHRASPDEKLDEPVGTLSWSTVRLRGQKPEPRCYHASTVIGRKMLVIGGDSGQRMFNDVQMLHLGKLTWTKLGNGSTTDGKDTQFHSQLMPAFRGHSLVPWGKNVLLVAGEMNPSTEKVEVWSFDIESEIWAKVSAKGEIPIARSGQSVTRAGSILILFGGEDAKGRKLNDIHILDMKSLMWVPLHTTGNGPSPRTRHTAAMYDDRFLLIFGGAAKSKSVNDLFSLDFDSMEWTRLKPKGQTPGPLAGHAGVLIFDKWYITGGNQHGQVNTWVLDVLQSTWSVIVTSNADSVIANQGLSIQLVQRKDRTFLVAFGGRGKNLSNEVQVLFIPPPEQAVPKTPPGVHEQLSMASTPDTTRSENQSPAYLSLPATGLACACVSVVESNMVTPERVRNTSPVESLSPGRITDSILALRQRFARVQDIMANDLRNNTSSVNLQLRLNQEKGVAEFSSRELCSHSEGSFSGSGEFHSPGIESPSKRESSGNQGSAKNLNSTRLNYSPSQVSHNMPSEGQNNAIGLKGSPDMSPVAVTGISGTGWSSRNGLSLKFEPSGSPQLEVLFDLDVDEELRHPDPERREGAIRKLKQDYERKLAAALRKHAITEGHLAAISKAKDEADKNLKIVLNGSQQADDRLAEVVEEQHELRNRLDQAESALEESNSLANIVHQENLRLEHDVAFLKAVLEDTQKELQTTRGVLAGERTRAFQLQVEVFELKQKLQAVEVG